LVADAAKSPHASLDIVPVNHQIQVADHPVAQPMFRHNHQEGRPFDKQWFDPRFVQCTQGLDGLSAQSSISLFVQIIQKAQVSFDFPGNAYK
jgi:hypothetical protein